MSYAPITVRARRALLDAFDALSAHRRALVLVGGQAVYLYTGEADVAIATETKDSDLAVVPRLLAADPLLEIAMERAGFRHDPQIHQPGAWLSPDGYPVELLLPATLHTGGGRRGGRIPPHSRRATRVVPGLEAAAVDHEWREVRALEPEDARVVTMQVATPAALVVAKLYKIGDRHDHMPGRLLDKDAHDLFRLLRAVDAAPVVASLERLRRDPIAGPVTTQALAWLQLLCGSPEALIPTMAGRAEAFVGSPPDVAAAMWALAQELLERLSA